MTPQEEFCPNMECPDRGKVGDGKIVCYSQKEKRCKCKACGKTFSVTKGTALYGIKKGHDVFVMVVTLLAFGCPVQAIVHAIGLDERTVRAWWLKSGEQSEQVHDSVIDTSQLDLQHVQADEIKVKMCGGTVWMVLAMMVSTRLWLGGIIGEKRDFKLIEALVAKVRQVALCRDLLLAVDGLVSYVKAFQRAFRAPHHMGKGSRPRLIAWQGIYIVQVVKQRTPKPFTITRRIVQGCEQRIQVLLRQSHGGQVINTAYIERLNATFRQRISSLTRHSRQVSEDVCPDGQSVVDWYHEVENLYKVAVALYPNDSDVIKRDRWFKTYKKYLYMGQIEKIISVLHKRDVAELARYFERHKRRMRYLKFREKGLPIGSGTVESGFKQFNQRLCGTGMRWKEANAKLMIGLRSIVLGHVFDDLWAKVA